MVYGDGTLDRDFPDSFCIVSGLIRCYGIDLFIPNQDYEQRMSDLDGAIHSDTGMIRPITRLGVGDLYPYAPVIRVPLQTQFVSALRPLTAMISVSGRPTEAGPCKVDRVIVCWPSFI
jgi:hypothetical protein